ncbi:MAG: histidine kinase [Hyphomicrobiaceae bacterium]
MPARAVEDGQIAQRRSNLDLKWLLVRRIVIVAVLCVLGGAVVVLRDVAAEAGRQNQEVVETIGKQLALQLIRIDSALDLAERFPDLDAIVNYTLRPGQCVQFRHPDGRTTNSNCIGLDSSARPAPMLFTRLYGPLFLGPADVERPLIHRGHSKGTVKATIDLTAVAGRAWFEVSRMLGLWTAMIAVMCLLVYVVVDRALRPTNEILTGLNRLAEGDLSCRLPRFRLRELDRISEVFNDLAQKLQITTWERSGLARQLVDAQERERRHIARELHDDVAQRLSALSCLATSIKIAAGQQATTVQKESDELVAMASGAMRSLRETLTYLRPPEIDDLGLLTSLQGLVAAQNRRARDVTQVVLQAEGSFEELPAETAAHIYRIIQEGLNNAVKHANARTVEITLHSRPGNEAGRKDGSGQIELTIVDDGTGADQVLLGNRLNGLGLIGMKERVYALNGNLTTGQSPVGGFELRVTFPTQTNTREAP